MINHLASFPQVASPEKRDHRQLGNRRLPHDDKTASRAVAGRASLRRDPRKRRAPSKRRSHHARLARQRPQPAAVVSRGLQSEYARRPAQKIAGSIAQAGTEHFQQVNSRSSLNVQFAAGLIGTWPEATFSQKSSCHKVESNPSTFILFQSERSLLRDPLVDAGGI